MYALRKIRFTLLCVYDVLTKLPFCCLFSLCFWQFWDLFGCMQSLITHIQKIPSQSLKKTSVTIFIKAFIAAYDSMTRHLAATIHQTWQLLDQKQEF